MFNFKINNDLRSYVLGSMPSGYSNLERAMHIYNALCTKLFYSMEYYLDSRNPNVVEKFTDTHKLQYVDGIKNKEVICYTFNAIFRQLLDEVQCCEYISPMRFDSDDSTRIQNLHEIVRLVIDGKKYKVDATDGILVNSDLMNAKYSNDCLVGWDIDADDGSLNNEQLDELENELYGVQDKIRSNAAQLDKDIRDYKLLKMQNADYFTLPIEARMMMFLELAVSGKDYTLFSFNNLIKMQKIIFNKSELGLDERGIKTRDIDKQKIELFFCYDRNEDEYKAFLLYNPKGYTNIAGLENFYNLETYEISLKNRTINGKEFNYNKIKEHFGGKVLDFNDERKYFYKADSYLRMMENINCGFFLTRKREFIMDGYGEKLVPMMLTKGRRNVTPSDNGKHL